MDWQPIETAPLMTAVLVYDFGYDIAYFNTPLNKWVACWDHRPIRISDRTVWQHLPPPPSSPQETE